MKLNEFQKQCSENAIYGDIIDNIPQGTSKEMLRLAYGALGLNGEAGEVADEIKKVIRNDHGVITEHRRNNLLLELSDVLWYLSSLSDILGFSLEEVAKANIKKLQSRRVNNDS